MKLNRDYTTDKVSKGKNTMEYIVLHHTDSDASIENEVGYLANNPAQVSVHYVVSKIGTVYQLADDDKITRHAGESKYDGKTNLNSYSIGIEVHSTGDEYTGEQEEATRELIKKLMKKHDIPYDHIIRHKDIAIPRGRRTDISDLFWNQEYDTYEDFQKSFRTQQPMNKEAEESRDLGIWNGWNKDKPATREQSAIMALRSYQLKNNKKIDNSNPIKEYEKAKDLGLWNGERGKDAATREEVSIMTYRASRL